MIEVSVTPNLEGKVRIGYIRLRSNPSSDMMIEKWISITQDPMGLSVAFAGIEDANALYTTSSQASPQSVNREASEASTKLYKITTTGSVEGVVFKDETGDTIDVSIEFIRNISDKYVYMSLTSKDIANHTQEGKSYVVRKKDGAVFIAKPPYIDYRTSEANIQTDYRQSVYYLNSGTLCKMYDYNEGVDIAILSKDYMDIDDNYSTRGFLVDPKGNVLFRYRKADDYGILCYTSSGEFTKSQWRPTSTFILKKEPENFYAIEDDTKLVRIKTTLPALTSEVVAEFQYNGTKIHFSHNNGYYYIDKDQRLFILDDMTVIIGSMKSEDKYVVKSTPALLRIDDEKTIKILPVSKELPAYKGRLKVSKGYIYGYTDENIFRISLTDANVETVYANNEYSIYDFNISNDEVITFSALELRKSQDVVAEIRNGVVKVLETDDTQKIIQLERIN